MQQSPPVEMVDLSRVRLDGGTQTRTSTSEAHVAELAEVLEGGGELPPVQLCSDGADYWPWDGHHTTLAHLRLKRTEVAAVVRSGTRRDAQLLACSANVKHGLKRSNEDKRKSVKAALALEPTWSQGRIAEWCGVSQRFVSTLTRESTQNRSESDGACLTQNGSESNPTVGRDGRAINKQNIGRKAGEKGGGAEETPGDVGTTPAKASPPDNLGALGERAGGVDAAVAPPVPQGVETAYAEALADFDEAEKLLRAAAAVVNRLAARPGAELYRRRLKLEERGGRDHFHCPDIENARRELRAARPHVLGCPYCGGEGGPDCPACKGLPYVTEEVWRRAPDALKNNQRAA